MPKDRSRRGRREAAGGDRSLVGGRDARHLPRPVWRAISAFAPALLWGLVIWQIGGATRVPVAPAIPGIDKVAHFVMYGVLGWLAGRGWTAFGGRTLAAVLIALGLLLGGGDEIRQATVPGRAAELLDWVADAAGFLAGFQLAAFIARRRMRR